MHIIIYVVILLLPALSIKIVFNDASAGPDYIVVLQKVVNKQTTVSTRRTADHMDRTRPGDTAVDTARIRLVLPQTHFTYNRINRPRYTGVSTKLSMVPVGSRPRPTTTNSRRVTESRTTSMASGINICSFFSDIQKNYSEYSKKNF